MIIYAITCEVTGKRYIGMTEMTPGRRWDAHLRACRNGAKTALYGAMRKHGAERFALTTVVTILPGLSRNDMADIERLVIAQEGTLAPAGYNMTAGGDGIPRGFKHRRAYPHRPWSEARRAAHVLKHPPKEPKPPKMKEPYVRPSRATLTVDQRSARQSAMMKARWAAERETLIAALWTDDRRVQQSESNRSRRGQPSPRRGVAMSDEQRGKLAANWTPEKRAALSAKLRALAASRPKRASPKAGKRLSDEHRAKLRAAWARNPDRHEEQRRRNLANDSIRHAHQSMEAA